jgi:hypothetical protein
MERSQGSCCKGKARRRGRNCDVTTRLAAPKAASLGLTPERERLGSGWNHVVKEDNKGSGISYPNPYFILPGQANRQEAARFSSRQKKASYPEVPVMKNQARVFKIAYWTHSPLRRSSLEGIADL